MTQSMISRCPSVESYWGKFAIANCETESKKEKQPSEVPELQVDGFISGALGSKLRRTSQVQSVLQEAGNTGHWVKSHYCCDFLLKFENCCQNEGSVKPEAKQNKAADGAALFSTHVCRCSSQTSHHCVPASQQCTKQLILQTPNGSCALFMSSHFVASWWPAFRRHCHLCTPRIDGQKLRPKMSRPFKKAVIFLQASL